jgi:hypothetical protein
MSGISGVGPVGQTIYTRAIWKMHKHNQPTPIPCLSADYLVLEKRTPVAKLLTFKIKDKFYFEIK